VFTLKCTVIKWGNNTIRLELTLEKTEGAIKNGQSRETGNTGHTRRRKTKQNHNTISVGHNYTQTNTNNAKRHDPPTNNWRKCSKSNRNKILSKFQYHSNKNVDIYFSAHDTFLE